jgi:metal-responsive CopG/Arc/MetJ family transcriptional regulator
MAARLNEETTKIHVHIFKSDLEELDAIFCRKGERTIGRAKAIRDIIRAWIIMNRKKQNIRTKPDPELAELINDRKTSD